MLSQSQSASLGNATNLHQGMLGKRSQNKKRFTPINYKQRWFQLTSVALIYYDGMPEGRRREKGRILLNSVNFVEVADLGTEPPSDARPPPSPTIGDSQNNCGNSNISGIVQFSAFQVGYSLPSGQQLTLYAVAHSDESRDQWIEVIRRACIGEISSTRPVATHFHPSPWANRRYMCCSANQRSAEGCVPITWTAASSLVTPLSSTTFVSPTSTVVGTNTVLGTSSPKNSTKAMAGTAKVVVALYNFQAIESGDLSLNKGMEYEIVDDSQEHWWKVQDSTGAVGYIPSNYVKQKELVGLQQYDWYVGDMSRQPAEMLLKQEDKEGCFVVRNSSTKGLYTLSLFTQVPHPQVKHYHIKQNAQGQYYLSEKHMCLSVPDLINYHMHNAGGLASRLRHPPSSDRSVPATAGLSHDKWEIDPSELMLQEELGSGQFGVVRRGKWRGSIDVAVKMMKEGSMSEDDFIDEAKVMTKLQHQHLVQLYGVCSKHRPIFIVTEYMKNGSLLLYLRRHEVSLIGNLGMLMDVCTQICKGMAYLERHNYIHRDLAARNCLVGAENLVKVADFGLARYVLDDQYTSSGGTKFPIKWAPPEVLNYTRFSSKSDVWAYGVLMWEVFTCGKMPYGRLKNTEVVERVQRGGVLEKPKSCPKEAYEIMRKCWSLHPDDRPPFRVLKDELIKVARLLLLD